MKANPGDVIEWRDQSRGGFGVLRTGTVWSQAPGKGRRWVIPDEAWPEDRERFPEGNGAVLVNTVTTRTTQYARICPSLDLERTA